MPRFSLRDLFWLTLVAGMGCALWVDRGRIASLEQDSDFYKGTLEIEMIHSRALVEGVQQRGIEDDLKKLGLEIDYPGTGLWFPPGELNVQD